jgi:hypothetical protein
VKGSDALGVNVDEAQIVQLLQNEMRRIGVDRATRARARKNLEGKAIRIRPRLDGSIAEVDARFLTSRGLDASHARARRTRSRSGPTAAG